MAEETTRPLRADAERNRRRILAAAAELFAERGVAVTLDDIAAHAGVGVGTVYRRFPDRDALVEAVFEERLSAMVAVAEEGLAIEDPWEGFEHFMVQGMALQAGDRAMSTILLGTSFGNDGVAQMRERIAPVVERLLQRAQDAGVVRADLGQTDIPMLQLAITTTILFAGDIGPEVWRRLQSVVLDGMRARDDVQPLPGEPLDLDDFARAMGAWKGGAQR